MARSVVVLAIVVVALTAPATATATHRGGEDSASDNASCVAQFVQPGAHAGRYGEVVSFFAHEFHPLGVIVSANARGPKNACLVTP
jgi:hypothetical protein